MAAPFRTVPDWGSWENQGGGVAVADLDADGRPDLIVFQIDGPEGVNRGRYRVGIGLDRDGNVADGWSPWHEVPEWDSWENQGGGVAVADLTGSGRLDLVVFQIDNPPQQNRGLYRVGRDLGPDGTVRGGWGPWREVPNWRSWENQGGAITVADIDGDGKPELLVFQIDNPPGLNHGLYCIGRGLTDDGIVTGGWGPWLPVIGWLQWEDAGAGIAVADLDGNGRPELILFQVDNPDGPNAGLYQIGWNLDETGRPNEGWSPWVAVPDWDSPDDAGAGIALAHFTGEARPRMVAFRIEARPQENVGGYRVDPLVLDVDTAAERGYWRLLPYDSQVLPVHAALLHTGKVLFFAGSGNSVARFQSPRYGDIDQGIYTSVVWDYANGNSFGHPPTVREHGDQRRPIDFFCGGEAFLPDGRLLVAGGTLEYDVGGHGFYGRRDALAFDPATEEWSSVSEMDHGRWYPTLLALGNGRVLATSGIDESGGPNEQLEIYDEGVGWTDIGRRHLPLYPHLFLLADGRLFASGGQMDTEANAAPQILDLAGSRPTAVDGLTEIGRRNQSASVLLPPAQDQRVLIVGGGPEDDTVNAGQEPPDAVANADLVDLEAARPRYHPAAPLQGGRMHLNATLLPDRTVLVCGGSGRREEVFRATLEAESYDPVADAWTIRAAAAIPRMYHSVALLLPDGRVVAAGSNPDKGGQDAWEPPDPLEELRLEVFSPPYLFHGERPTLPAGVLMQWRYGATVPIETPQAASVRWVNLIRSGVTTHAFNNEQRLVDVPFERWDHGVLAATVPENPNLLPPGWYMLFLTDDRGAPSEAAWVRIVPP